MTDDAASSSRLLGRRLGWLERAITAIAAISALATLAFVAHAFFFSPQNPVAAEIAFEALRVARKLPLYVDPWLGAWEDGAPPARYYVLYTPMFPLLIGKLSSGTLASVQMTGRTIAVLSWLGFHAVAIGAAREERRRVTAIAAMLALGVYFLARHAASMSPDALATLLVCAGVARAVKKNELDPIAAMLIVAAPFIKPSCLGGVAGAGLVLVLHRPPGWLRGLLACVGTFIVFAGLCHLASDGAWLTNIRNSTGQPLTLTRLVQEMGSRILVLGVPHAVVAWLAWKRKTTWLVVGPLLGSIAWATFMMAKHGSGTHYWFEPTGLAVIAIAQMPASPTPDADAKWIPWAALAFAVVAAVTSWPQYLAEPARYKKHDAVVAALREHCVHPPGDFVMSSDFDLEMELNGRINVPSWQSAFLARKGKFPLEEWQADLARPEVKWLVLAIDPRSPPGDSNDERVELSPFYDVLKDVLLENFEFDAVVAGTFVFRRKPH